MEAAPTLRELFDSILDMEPFEVIYDCGKRSKFKNLVKELETAIDDGMKGCIQLNPWR